MNYKYHLSGFDGAKQEFWLSNDPCSAPPSGKTLSNIHCLDWISTAERILLLRGFDGEQEESWLSNDPLSAPPSGKMLSDIHYFDWGVPVEYLLRGWDIDGVVEVWLSEDPLSAPPSGKTLLDIHYLRWDVRASPPPISTGQVIYSPPLSCVGGESNWFIFDTWVCPVGITSVNVAIIGPGGNGGNAEWTSYACAEGYPPVEMALAPNGAYYPADNARRIPKYAAGGGGGGAGPVTYLYKVQVKPGASYRMRAYRMWDYYGELHAFDTLSGTGRPGAGGAGGGTPLSGPAAFSTWLSGMDTRDFVGPSTTWHVVASNASQVGASSVGLVMPADATVIDKYATLNKTFVEKTQVVVWGQGPSWDATYNVPESSAGPARLEHLNFPLATEPPTTIPFTAPTDFAGYGATVLTNGPSGATGGCNMGYGAPGLGGASYDGSQYLRPYQPLLAPTPMTWRLYGSDLPEYVAGLPDSHRTGVGITGRPGTRGRGYGAGGGGAGGSGMVPFHYMGGSAYLGAPNFVPHDYDLTQGTSTDPTVEFWPTPGNTGAGVYRIARGGLGANGAVIIWWGDDPDYAVYPPFYIENKE